MLKYCLREQEQYIVSGGKCAAEAEPHDYVYVCVPTALSSTNMWNCESADLSLERLTTRFSSKQSVNVGILKYIQEEGIILDIVYVFFNSIKLNMLN